MTPGREGRLVERMAGVLKAAHLLMLFAGAGLVAWTSYMAIDSAYTQWAGSRALAAGRTAPYERGTSKSPLPPARSPAPRGAVIGKLALPRLSLSFVILEGTAARTLDRSVGRVEGTAGLGEAGNIGIAGHRNTHFRRLEQVRRGDEIVLTSHSNEYRYLVEWVHLFRPDEVQVLDDSHGPAVTLITCFPFEYAGSAPLRYVVRALPDYSTRERLMAASSSARINR